jgi:hypothetical protein
METMNTRTDTNLYGELLLKSLPAVIESDSENDRLIAEVEALQSRGAHLLPEERRLLSLLVPALIFGENWPLGRPPGSS